VLAAGFEDLGLQLLLLLVGGAIYAISKIVEKVSSLRQLTRQRMEREGSRTQLEWAPRERMEPEGSAEERPRPPRRPPRVRPVRVEESVAADLRRPASRRAARPEVKTKMVARLRLDARSLRDAIVYRELLGPPRALRPFRPTRQQRW